MEHNIGTNSRQQQQTREQHISQKLLEQQQQATNNNENQQQFCLRWHNHQTSLLSTLPILLDQSHLTDVTISAEGRTLRAHRVVLSACSSFFLEIFRTLETTHHPVIIIPGASFSAIVSLLTFMYSGEVNVYEEQIPMLLSLAETLGIKGLADVHNNLQKSTKSSNESKETFDECKKEELEKSQTRPSSPQTQSACGNFSLPQAPTATNLNTNATASSFNPLLSPSLNTKFTSPLENLFLKSLQFYPNLMHQPLNFSQTALNKTSELLAKYQQQCNLYQANLGMTTKDLMPALISSEEETLMAKRFCTGLEKKTILSQPQLQQHQLILQQQKDFKRIDKIVENLRGGAGNNICGSNTKHEKSPDNFTSTHLHNPLTPLSIKTSTDNYSSNTSPALAKSPLFPSPSNAESSAQLHSQLAYNISPEDQLKLQQHLDKYAQSCVRSMEAANENLKHEAVRMMSNEKLNTSNPQTKTPSNSKLYATCFICHKQLSNQYNLRVHLETHQNVRYACNVCSHVSRSKDALRKHVSYRHPGAPSPCETEARRKRANKVLTTQLNAASLVHNSSSSEEVTPTSPNTVLHFQNAPATPTTPPSNDLNCNEGSSLTAAQLSSAYQMFMPNQFHLAAAAANAAHQQQQQQAHEKQQQQQSPSSVNQMQTKDFNNSSMITTSTHSPITDNTKLILNNSPISSSAANTTSSSNTNELQISTNTNNNNVEARISPNIQI